MILWKRIFLENWLIWLGVRRLLTGYTREKTLFLSLFPLNQVNRKLKISVSAAKWTAHAKSDSVSPAAIWAQLKVEATDGTKPSLDWTVFALIV